MSNLRNDPFSLGREQVFPMPLAAVVPVSDVAKVETVVEKARIEQNVKADLTEFAGNDSSFVLYGQPALLRFPAIGEPLVVATFTVPAGRTLEVDRIDWWCSEPFLYGNQQVGWRPTIDGAQLPFWSSQTPSNRPDYMLLPLAPTVGNEPRFSPVYLYSDSTLTIEVAELLVGPTAFNSNVWVAAYVYGTLRKPGGN